MKKAGIFTAIILISIFFITNVSAEIAFSRTESVYNLGDEVTVEATVNPAGLGFLDVYLICQGNQVQVFNGIPNTNGKSTINLPLTQTYIEDLEGECYFLGEYNSESKESMRFEISNKFNVYLDIESYKASPGDNITVSGVVEKQNKEKIEGKIELTIPLVYEKFDVPEEEETQSNDTIDNETETVEEEPVIETKDRFANGVYYADVVAGHFSVKVDLLKNLAAGDYVINIRAFKEDVQGITSEGVGKSTLEIVQVLTQVDVALNKQNIDPGTEFTFNPQLLDQTGKEIFDDITIIIKDMQGVRSFERIVDSGQTFTYMIPTNITAGYYEIEASREGFSKVKKFYINEKAIAKFELANATLIVTNIGNVPYKKDVQVDLNGKPFVRKLNLDLGEDKEFRLTGANTEYDVKISDGDTEIRGSGVALTGRAIGVKEIKEGAGVAIASPVVWVVLIIILVGGIAFLIRDRFKKKSIAYSATNNKQGIKERMKNKLSFKRKGKVVNLAPAQNKQVQQPVQKIEKKVEQVQKPTEKKQTPGALVAPNQAEPVLVLKGKKAEAAVIVLKIKNKISQKAKQNLEKSIEHVYDTRAAVYDKGDYIYILFSPLMTRSLKNELIATKIAAKIKAFLNHHNARESEEHKIHFGLGVHLGNVINKVDKKKLQFTALGNFITFAKRLASASNGEILISKELYEKTNHEIRVDKRGIGTAQVYEIKKVLNVEQNKKFLKSFLQRIEGKK